VESCGWVGEEGEAREEEAVEGEAEGVHRSFFDDETSFCCRRRPPPPKLAAVTSVIGCQAWSFGPRL